MIRTTFKIITHYKTCRYVQLTNNIHSSDRIELSPTWFDLEVLTWSPDFELLNYNYEVFPKWAETTGHTRLAKQNNNNFKCKLDL